MAKLFLLGFLLLICIIIAAEKPKESTVDDILKDFNENKLTDLFIRRAKISKDEAIKIAKFIEEKKHHR